MWKQFDEKLFLKHTHVLLLVFALVGHSTRLRSADLRRKDRNFDNYLMTNNWLKLIIGYYKFAWLIDFCV